MNPFSSLQNDVVYVENDEGERFGPYKTAIGTKGGLSAVIFEESLDVEEGWKLCRDLPNSKEDIYTIIEINYSPGLHSIPANWKLSLNKDKSLKKSVKPSSTTINISNSQGIQVGDNNIQNIANSLSGLIKEIESSDATEVEKSKTKQILKSLLTNPVVAGVLGGAASGLAALLG